MTLRLRTSVKVFRMICKQNVANAETAAVLPRAVAFGDTPTIDFCKTYKPHFQRFQLEFLTNSGYMLNDISIYICIRYIIHAMYTCIYVYVYIYIVFFEDSQSLPYCFIQQKLHESVWHIWERSTSKGTKF